MASSPFGGELGFVVVGHVTLPANVNVKVLCMRGVEVSALKCRITLAVTQSHCFIVSGHNTSKGNLKIVMCKSTPRFLEGSVLISRSS